jgi:hypothetical protein
MPEQSEEYKLKAYGRGRGGYDLVSCFLHEMKKEEALLIHYALSFLISEASVLRLRCWRLRLQSTRNINKIK